MRGLETPLEMTEMGNWQFAMGDIQFEITLDSSGCSRAKRWQSGVEVNSAGGGRVFCIYMDEELLWSRK